MWRFAQFGTICTYYKNVESTHGELLHLIKLQAKAYNSTESNTSPWVFYTFFKLYKLYQIQGSI